MNKKVSFIFIAMRIIIAGPLNSQYAVSENGGSKDRPRTGLVLG
jgi:hypothetical protein